MIQNLRRCFFQPVLLNAPQLLFSCNHQANFKRFLVTLKKYQLKTRLFDQLITDELRLLFELFNKNNFELKIAGGAVRDLLMDIMPHDVDLATNALPTQMLDMFKKENIRVLNLNGLKHGTVPVRVNDKFNYEITTLRIDVKTYGRHAEVEFTNDWHKDAIRRDLTVNSLFLDPSGEVLDFVNGVEDLRNKKIRFVGIADKRVKEDYLRILRYFRFYSRVCTDCNKHDQESLEAIRNNAQGLATISGERVGYELRKIIGQKFSDSFMKMFYELKLADHLGLPKNGDIEKYEAIYNRCFHLNPHAMTLLYSLLKTSDDVDVLSKRIKLSKEEKYLLNALSKFEKPLSELASNEEILRYLLKQFVHPKANKDKPLKKQEAIELLKYLGKSDLIQSVNELNLPVFMLNNMNLLNHQVFDEASNGFVKIETIKDAINKFKFSWVLYDLKLKWIESDFKLTETELLNMVDMKFLQKFLKKNKNNKN